MFTLYSSLEQSESSGKLKGSERNKLSFKTKDDLKNFLGKQFTCKLTDPDIFDGELYEIQIMLDYDLYEIDIYYSEQPL